MTIKHAILALLDHGYNTASALQQAFDNSTGGMWPINIGQVSQTLTRLERDNLIHHSENVLAANGRETKAYALTEDGRTELNQWWTEPHHATGHERDELVTKLALAIATNLPLDTLLRTLDAQRQATILRLGKIYREKAQIKDDQVAELLMHERLIFNLEAETKWLEQAEAIIRPYFAAQTNSIQTNPPQSSVALRTPASNDSTQGN